MSLPSNWQAFYPDGLNRDMTLEPRLMGDLLDEMVKDHGAKTAIAFDGSDLSFTKVNSEANVIAKGLMASGLRPGARVGLFMPNSPHFLIALFGLWRAGATVVPLAPTLPREELQRRIKETELSMIITLNLKLILPLLIAGLLDDSQVKKVIVAPWRFYSGFWTRLWDWFFGGSKRVAPPKGDDRFTGWKALRKSGSSNADALPKLDPEELALLQYGMGAEASQKAAMLSHKSVAAAVDSQQAFISARAGSLAAFAAILPLFTAMGLISTALAGMKGGAKIALSLNLDAAALAKQFAKGAITALVGPTALFAALWQQGPLLQKPGGVRKSKRLMMVTDLEIDPALAENWEQATESDLVLALGQEETAGLSLASTEQGLVPMPGLELEDRAGLLAIKGPQVMKAYYGDAAASQAVLHEGLLATPWNADDLPLADSD